MIDPFSLLAWFAVIILSPIVVFAALLLVLIAIALVYTVAQSILDILQKIVNAVRSKK